MAMNKKIILFAACLLALLGGQRTLAQEQESQEKIKALKTAFFTEKLGLTSEEAAVFWPIYNAYEKDKDALRQKQRREVFERIGSGNYTEGEARAILDRYLELEEQEEELDKRFNLKMAETFSATRTLKLFEAEHAFRKRLLREFRKRGGNNHP